MGQQSLVIRILATRLVRNWQISGERSRRRRRLLFWRIHLLSEPRRSRFRRRGAGICDLGLVDNDPLTSLAFCLDHDRASRRTCASRRPDSHWKFASN